MPRIAPDPSNPERIFHIEPVNVPPETEQAIARLRPGDHICLVYANRDEQIGAILPFVRQGLKRGERMVYIADENTVAEVRAILDAGGVDTHAELERGALVMATKRESYLRDGRFDPDAMIAFLARETERALRDGFTAFRVTGEMTWALAEGQDATRLIEYESKLNLFFPQSRSLGLCQYNLARFPAATIRDVFATHPIVAARGRIVKNRFYVPPEEFLRRSGQTQEIDWLLRTLLAFDEAERQRRDAQNRLERVLEAAPVGIWTTDADGRITAEMGQGLGIIGQTTGHFVGRNALEILASQPESLANFRAALDSIPTLEVHRADGKWIQVSYTPSLDPAGRVQGVTAILLDVTEHRRAEDARAEAQRLKELVVQKTELLSVASHELNTPITPIMVQLGLLRTEKFGPLTQRQRESLEILSRSSERMTAMIRDMLDASRLQAGRLKLDRHAMSLRDVLREACTAFEQPAKDAGVALRMADGDDPHVMGDRRRLEQVIFNLVSNAIKYTPRGGRVDLEIAHGGGQAMIHVTDTGIGLTKQQIDRLFQPFVQVHDATVIRRPGTGLGLYISKGIVDQHGGRIRVESAGPGQGSRFTVALPIASPPTGTPSRALTTEPSHALAPVRAAV